MLCSSASASVTQVTYLLKRRTKCKTNKQTKIMLHSMTWQWNLLFRARYIPQIPGWNNLFSTVKFEDFCFYCRTAVARKAAAKERVFTFFPRRVVQERMARVAWSGPAPHPVFLASATSPGSPRACFGDPPPPGPASARPRRAAPRVPAGPAAPVGGGTGPGASWPVWGGPRWDLRVLRTGGRMPKTKPRVCCRGCCGNTNSGASVATGFPSPFFIFFFFNHWHVPRLSGTGDVCDRREGRG